MGKIINVKDIFGEDTFIHNGKVYEVSERVSLFEKGSCDIVDLFEIKFFTDNNLAQEIIFEEWYKLYKENQDMICATKYVHVDYLYGAGGFESIEDVEKAFFENKE